MTCPLLITSAYGIGATSPHEPFQRCTCRPPVPSCARSVKPFRYNPN